MGEPAPDEHVESRLAGRGRLTGRPVRDRSGRSELRWRIDLQLTDPPGGEITLVGIRLPVRRWPDIPGTTIVDGPGTARHSDGDLISTTGAGPVRIGTQEWTGQVDRLMIGIGRDDDGRLATEVILRELNGERAAVIDAAVELIGIRIDDDPVARQVAEDLFDVRDSDVTRDEQGVLLRPTRPRTPSNDSAPPGSFDSPAGGPPAGVAVE